jgi:hypothetical protein
MPVRPWVFSTARLSCLIGVPRSMAKLQPHLLRVERVDLDAADLAHVHAHVLDRCVDVQPGHRLLDHRLVGFPWPACRPARPPATAPRPPARRPAAARRRPPGVVDLVVHARGPMRWRGRAAPVGEIGADGRVRDAATTRPSCPAPAHGPPPAPPRGRTPATAGPGRATMTMVGAESACVLRISSSTPAALAGSSPEVGSSRNSSSGSSAIARASAARLSMPPLNSPGSFRPASAEAR